MVHAVKFTKFLLFSLTAFIAGAYALIHELWRGRSNGKHIIR